MAPELNNEDISAFQTDARALAAGVSADILGQGVVVEQLVVSLLVGGHVLLEGLPGLGKTEAVKAAARAVGARMARVQGTPDLMPSDILGTEILTSDGNADGFEFLKGPVFSQILMLDEINRAPPKTQSALLEAMQERQISYGGALHPLPRPFIVLATQNMIELEGTFPLPEAQLDRFFCKIVVPYPDRETLIGIAGLREKDRESGAAAVMSPERLLEMEALVARVFVPAHAKEAAADLVLATHPGHPDAIDKVRDCISFGASPRALQALLQAASAVALMDGRAHVARDDIAAMALPVMRHRIFLSLTAKFEGVDCDSLLEEILSDWRARWRRQEG